MTRRDYVLVLVVAPAAAVATLWVLVVLDPRGSLGLYVFGVALIPALAGIVWGVTPRDSVEQWWHATSASMW